MSTGHARQGRSGGEPASGGEPRAAPGGLRARTVARLADLGLRPNRDLGQNFLVDGRFLDVVEEAAELSAADVVLEVGGGLGVLSERLAPRVAHLHVVEVDPVLIPALEESLIAFPNATLHLVDAVRLDFSSLLPAPGKLVANLPYGVAATVLLKSVEELPGADLLVAMVQAEVAERLAATPGSRVYGATSVLAQLACDVRLHRRVPRSAFHPAPHVDSAIVVLRRLRPAPAGEVRTLIRGAFAHRRKTLAGSLALSGLYPPGIREQAREALASLGHPPDVRAERLSPPELESLAGLLPEAAESVEGMRSGRGRDGAGTVARGAP